MVDLLVCAIAPDALQTMLFESGQLLAVRGGIMAVSRRWLRLFSSALRMSGLVAVPNTAMNQACTIETVFCQMGLLGPTVSNTACEAGWIAFGLEMIYWHLLCTAK